MNVRWWDISARKRGECERDILNFTKKKKKKNQRRLEMKRSKNHRVQRSQWVKLKIRRTSSAMQSVCSPITRDYRYYPNRKKMRLTKRGGKGRDALLDGCSNILHRDWSWLCKFCAMIPKRGKSGWRFDDSNELGKHFCQFVDTVAIFDDR